MTTVEFNGGGVVGFLGGRVEGYILNPSLLFFFKLRFFCGLICDEWGVGNLPALVTVERS